jgi:hypothetical protein
MADCEPMIRSNISVLIIGSITGHLGDNNNCTDFLTCNEFAQVNSLMQMLASDLINEDNILPSGTNLNVSLVDCEWKNKQCIRNSVDLLRSSNFSAVIASNIDIEPIAGYVSDFFGLTLLSISRKETPEYFNFDFQIEVGGVDPNVNSVFAEIAAQLGVSRMALVYSENMLSTSRIETALLSHGINLILSVVTLCQC